MIEHKKETCQVCQGEGGDPEAFPCPFCTGLGHIWYKRTPSGWQRMVGGRTPDA